MTKCHSQRSRVVCQHRVAICLSCRRPHAVLRIPCDGDSAERPHRWSALGRRHQPNIGLGKAVAPDLPYVRQDVPDDSEAPQGWWSLRQAGKESRTPCQPPASKGITAYLSAAYARGGARTLRAAVARRSRVGAVPRPCSRPKPRPTNSPSHRARVKQQIAKTKSDLNESSQGTERGGRRGRQGTEQAGCGKCAARSDPPGTHGSPGQGRPDGGQVAAGSGRPGRGSRCGCRRTGATGRPASQSRPGGP